jgi:hypothetical protein
MKLVREMTQNVASMAAAQISGWGNLEARHAGMCSPTLCQKL